MSDINDETITFRFKRIHFYAAAIPLAFLAGLAVGFVQWGSQAPEAATSNTSPETQLASGADASTQEQVVEEEQSIAEQIAAIERYDIEINEYNPTFGPEDALVTIIEFSDFEFQILLNSCNYSWYCILLLQFNYCCTACKAIL